MTYRSIGIAAAMFAVLAMHLHSAGAAIANEPKGYIVGLVTVSSKDWVKDYRSQNAKLLEKHGGRILVRSKPATMLEGTAPKVDTIVVVEFPTVEHAKAWYNDPDYKPLIGLRQTGSEAQFILMEQLAR